MHSRFRRIRRPQLLLQSVCQGDPLGAGVPTPGVDTRCLLRQVQAGAYRFKSIPSILGLSPGKCRIALGDDQNAVELGVHYKINVPLIDRAGTGG